ncbi:hypothetical protein [Emticicia sp. BO119]|uniref:hypothetical protein n=1 Tax=Emticicia sp. BO119 TaxID=2757768 RepID=UPI0015F0945F|nr:hypothetical protein [Emticicia sp. BO119]MBA4852042.1 hypothetical protein [Emticicia sp. BO119]
MKKFSDFEIKNEQKTFVGDKIKISKILNKEIVVLGFEIKDSTVFKGKCLYLQIEVGDKKHLVFTGSKMLIESIQKVPKDGFPFETTIVEENEMYQFT